MTCVFRYGLLPATLGAEIVSEQISLAHRYYNALIELERQRRVEIQAATADDGIRELDAAIAAAEAELTAARAAVSKERSEARSAKAGDVSPVKVIVARLKDLRGELRVRRKARRDDPAAIAAAKAVNDAHGERVRAARAACGVYWGTYLLIEESVQQAAKVPGEPRFRRWTGEGAVGVQCQGGVPVGELLAATDTRLRITPDPEPVPGRLGKPLRRVMLRVGSVGRDPVWAAWPVILHRPLPADARVKWAKVVRRMNASKPEWSLHLVIETAAPREVAAPVVADAVAVDLGWRKAAIGGDPTTRAGGWTDGVNASDVLVEPEVIGELRKCDDIRSIRDRHRNAMQARLSALFAALPLTGEHRKRTAHLAQWKSPGRFAGLAIWWRDHRLPGDNALLAELETWRKRDKHLWLWEFNARRGAIGRRRDQYRRIAAKFADRFAVLVIERLDLAAMKEVPPPESERESHPVSRSQLHATAPHELRASLVNAFRMRGREIVTVEPQPTVALVMAQYREGLGAAKACTPARSERFRRLRGLPKDETAA